MSRIEDVIDGKLRDHEGWMPTPKQIQDWINAIRGNNLTEIVIDLHQPTREDVKVKDCDTKRKKGLGYYQKD